MVVCFYIQNFQNVMGTHPYQGELLTLVLSFLNLNIY